MVSRLGQMGQLPWASTWWGGCVCVEKIEAAANSWVSAIAIARELEVAAASVARAPGCVPALLLDNIKLLCY